MKKWIQALILIAFVLLIGIVGGWNIRKVTHHCPVITHDTIKITDTVEYHIIDHVPYYVTRIDTVLYPDSIPVLPTKEDTLRILANYYSINIYDRVWQDTNLVVNMKDFISQNKSIHNVFNYKILRPQTIIQNTVDNSVTYNSYFNFGIGVPIKDIKYINLEANYVWNKGYVGIMYTPEINSFGIKGGATIFRFKKKN